MAVRGSADGSWRVELTTLVVDGWGMEVLTAYAEPASGPGWSNRPLWVIVRGHDGMLRQECLQPEQMGVDLLSLYDVLAAVQKAVMSSFWMG